MDIEKLKTFYHIVREKSMLKASKKLSLNKSSISRHLTALEMQVGKKLIDRNKNKLVLTSHGEFLFEKAHRILMEIEASQIALHLNEGQTKKVFTLSTTPALASSWLTFFLHEFIQQFPEIELQIIANNQLIDLSLKEADAAIRPYVNHQEHLTQTHLRSWRLFLYASPLYIQKFGMPKNIEDLENHRLIILGDSPNLYPHNYTEWPLFLEAKCGKIRKAFLTINSLEGMYNLVTHGVGIGSFSKELVEQKKATLIPILADQIFYDIDAYYIYLSALKNLKIIQTFETFLLKHAQK